MIFDGSKLSVNDSVFDVAFGSGHVIEINTKTNTFRVKFANKFFTYLPTGVGQFPRKTLFWRDPIDKFIPKKDDPLWDQFTRIREAVARELGY